MSGPSLAEVEHADWPSLQRMCSDLGLNPKGRSAVVRMRVADHVRQRAAAPRWHSTREHQAALLLRLHYPDLAERAWESTIQLDAPAPWVGLGHAQLSGGLLPEAAKSFTRAAAMGDPSADLHRAEVLAAGGYFEGAAQACERYLEARPGDLRGLLMRASFLERAGFEGESMRVLRASVDLHPDLRGLHRTLGRSLLRAGQPAAAAETFGEAVRTDAKDVDARADRGAALLLAGRTREAIGVLREALRLDPHRADALNNLGVAYLAMGNHRSACTNLERAAKQVESARILLNLGRALEGQGKTEAAMRAYEQVLRMRPEDPEAIAGRERLAPVGERKSVKPAKRARRPTRGRKKSDRSPPEVPPTGPGKP